MSKTIYVLYNILYANRYAFKDALYLYEAYKLLYIGFIA